ncbi:MAG: tetratricopeptide repeat protein, partial [Bacteroidales bacterium]|nr:tetratricopeptide repeat protein [Bacteroidales bacterium]
KKLNNDIKCFLHNIRVMSFKVILTCVYIIILSSGLFAETDLTLIDSLKSQLTNSNEHTKVEILNELSQLLINTSFDKALGYAEEALYLAKEINNKKEESKSLALIGTIHYYQGNYEKALLYFGQSLHLSEDINYITGITKTTNNIGLTYDYLGRLDLALEYHLRSLKIEKEIGNKKGIAGSYNNIGIIHQKLKKYNEALKYYFDVLELYDGSEKSDIYQESCNNIGSIYYEFEDFDKALEYYQKAYEMSKSLNNKELVASCLNNIGTVYYSTGNYEKALKFYFDSYQINSEAGDKWSMANNCRNIGGIYMQQNKFSKSSECFNQSLKLSKEIKARSLILSCYESLSDLFALQNNYERSLEYYKLYFGIYDSIYNDETGKKIAQLRTKYETEKKEKEIELLKQNEQIQILAIKKQKILRNSFIVGFLLIGILALAILRNLNRKKQSNKLIAAEKAKSDKLLLNILPSKVAADLKDEGKTKPENYKNVTVFFSDIVNFTNIFSAYEPEVIIDELNEMFTAFDDIMSKNQCERIKTIGDAYLAVCGMPEENPDHAENIINSAIEIRKYVEKRNRTADIKLKIRIGIHSGTVVGGVVGIRKYIFDIFGDTVNTASRMESKSKPMQINVSESTHKIVKNKFQFEEREPLIVKGKGLMKMYFVKC